PHRRLEQVRMLVDPAREVEGSHRHAHPPKELAAGGSRSRADPLAFSSPMCGIAGYFALAPRSLAPREVLARMVEAVRHRGPDDGGSYYDGRAALGHRRLSIIDLAGGRQPL